MEEIFNLISKANTYNDSNINIIWNLFREFYISDSNKKFFPKYPREETEEINFVISFLKNPYNNKKLSLFDSKFGYGAVILELENIFNSNKYDLVMLYLDSWKFTMSTKIRNFISAPQVSIDNIYIGTICSEERDLLKKIVDEIYQIVQTRTGDARSAKNTNGGHQKTPGFIYGIYQSALRQLPNIKLNIQTNKKYTIDETIHPKGGFTDVGMHTGGEKRCTIYALIKNVLYFVFYYIQQEKQEIECLDKLFKYNLLLFEIYLLEVEHKSKRISNPNDFIQMILSISKKAEDLIDYDKNLIEIIFKRIQPIYEDLVIKFQTTDNLNILFRQIDLLSLRSPSITLETDREISSQPTEDIFTLAKRNLGSFEFIRSNSDFDEFYKLIKSSKIPLEYKISYFERYMFQKLKNLDPFNSAFKGIKDVSKLVDLLDFYENLITQMKSKLNDIYISKLNSHLLLMTWGFYCFIHQIAKENVKLLEDFSVPLDPNDLFYLRFNDILTVKALIGISNYLKIYNTSNPKIFSKKYDEMNGTFKFIIRYFNSDENLKNILKEQVATSNLKNKQRFEKVLERRKQYSNKMKDLEKEEKKLRELEDSYKEYQNSWAVFNKKKDIKRIEEELEIIKRFDEVIIHPISDNDIFAKYGIFFFHMPEILYHLFNLGFMSYLKLNDPNKINEEKPFSQNQISFFSHYASESKYTNNKKNFDVGIFSPPNRNSIGHKDIFEIQNELDGVWYPGEISSFIWKNHNPFLFNK